MTAVGDRFGPYQLTRRLGEGGFGVTWEALHLRLNRLACLKIPHPELDAGQILREAQVLWDLHHPSLITLRDVLEHPDDGRPVLAMRFVPGVTLDQLRPIGLKVAFPVFGRMLRALKVLHHKGIVHGDVKPTNIIVEPDLHGAVLIDLGLATLRPDARSRPAGYTPRFAAPETLDGAPPLPESDLYSLGLTLAWALGGDIVHRVLPDGVPEEVWGFIARLTRPRLEDRPPWPDGDDLLAQFYQLAQRLC